jgi:NitT/TauT family transport system substrate-binding protein
MFNKLTTFGKICVIAVILAIVGTGLYFASSKLSENGVGGSSLFSKSDYDATVMVNTYCGFEPIVWGNGGLEGTDDSYFAQKFGLKLKIIIMDDFEASRAALKNDEAQIAYCTLDALPVEMSASGTMTDMKYFMLLNFSAGADALVVNKSINNVSDLKGKTVAFAEGTASHTLLINTLETSGLSQDDIKMIKVGSGLEARDAFTAKQVDAACVWAPDDEDCIKAVQGSKVLTSTAQANTLVTDGLIAKKEWLDKNFDKAKKIVEAILWANSEIKYNKDAFNEGAKVFAKAFETDVDFALASSSKINYATLSDEVNWMGLNSTYNGMTGERIYKKMSITYSNLKLCKSPLSWNKVAYTGIIESLMENNNLDNKQDETGTKSKEFTAPTTEMETVAAISNKKVTINFPTAGYTLDNEARAIIDREFVDIAQQFSNSRIRVEGNTDNTGNYDSNVILSKKRAQAVVDYLVNEYGMSKNRFIVVGNGPKRAVKDGVNGSNENYRTTDFNLIED